MTNAIDPRIIKVTIEVNGRLKTYTLPLFLKVTGTKYANPLQNDAEIMIANLDKATQDYILTETSPFNLNRTPKQVIVEAGRQSYGTFVLYKGNIITSYVTQPPDIGVTLKCLTGNFLKGNIISRSQPGMASLQRVSQGIAQDTSTILNFQATDKNISNYSFVGGALSQLNFLNQLGGINSFIDNDVLYVKDNGKPLNNTLRVLNSSNGMIGIPEFTEQGIKVKYLMDNKTSIGGLLQVQSDIYPAVNGYYVIYKLGFDIASRDTPFYYIAEGYRIR